MLIGINASAAFKEPRTGVEEYTYQLIKHLAMLKEAEKHRFLLYVGCHPEGAKRPKDPVGKTTTAFSPRDACRQAGMASPSAQNDLKLPENFIIKELKWPLPMWTQLRLASEMFFNRPDMLFIPVHILPLIHPENSIVTIHGLEYEYYPAMYPKRHLEYLRWSTKYALRHARKIIAVSENTKKDLVELYGGNPDKIFVVHHGVDKKITNPKSEIKNLEPYILYIGRLETKKNVQGLIAAFELLKEKYKIPHKLVLAGTKGWDFEKITLCLETEESVFRNAKKSQRDFFAPADLLARPDIRRDTMPAHKPKVLKTDSSVFLSSNFAFLKSDPVRLAEYNDIIFTGYISDEQKWRLLRNADCFVLPSFYEGFGMPILEAQQAGCPVVCSNVSSIPEVAGEAVLIEPNDIESIADGIYKVISDKNFKQDIIEKGFENVKKFSWQKCAGETLRVILNI